MKSPIWFAWLALLGTSALAEDPQLMVVFRPRHEAVLSAEVSSVVRKLRRELGQLIVKGQPLLLLDDRVYRSTLQQAQARLLNAKARLIASEKLALVDQEATQIKRVRAILLGAQLLLKEKKKLYADSSLSETEMEAARTSVAVAQADLELALKKGQTRKIELIRELAVARANVQTAEAGLQLARRDLAACRILAPFSGRVSQLLINAHEVVTPGKNLIEVVDDRTLLAQFLAPSRLVFKIKLGQQLKIRVRETGQQLVGKVSHIGALVDPSSSTVLIRVEVDNAAGKLRGGMRGMLALSQLTSGK